MSWPQFLRSCARLDARIAAVVVVVLGLVAAFLQQQAA